MKLYIWVSEYACWDEEVAFALAKSVEQARVSILLVHGRYIDDQFRKQILETQPEEHTKLVTFHFGGG